MTRLIVKNGVVVSPELGTIDADIVMDDGRISSVSERGAWVDDASADVIDATGLHVFPGFVDPHMHLGNYRAFEDDCVSETRAAAAGGVTTLISFCKAGRMLPTESQYAPILDYARRVVREAASVDVAFHVAIGGSEHIDEIESLVDAGTRSFKFYMAYRNDDGAKARGTIGLDDATLLAGFRRLAELRGRGLAVVHCENDDLCRSGIQALGSHSMSFLDWEASRPPISEAEAVSRALMLSEAAGCALYIVHVSTDDSLRLIADARRRGRRDVFAEVTPHYLALDSAYCQDLPNPAVAKTCPPIRHSANRERLWEGVSDGTIDTIGSDHCAFDPGQKLDIIGAVAGFGSVDLYPALVVSEALKRGISLELIAAATSLRPATLFGLYPRKGSLRPGADGDLALFDLESHWKYDVSTTLSSAKSSPYDGWEVGAAVAATILRGTVVARNGAIVNGNQGVAVTTEAQ